MEKRVSLLDTECCYLLVKLSKPILMITFSEGGPCYKIFVSFRIEAECK